MKSLRQRVVLALFFPLVLMACASSENENPPASEIDDRRLVYIDSEAVHPALKPHHTVVVTQAAVAEDGDSGYQELPYEILNAGQYKFCVPEDDSLVDRVELLNPDGQEVGRWVKGKECKSVRLQPGNYTLHIHHALDGYDPLLFIKPHAVTAIPQEPAAAVSKAATYNNNIPDYQFVDALRRSLWEVVRHNTAKNILDSNWEEGWGLTAEYNAWGDHSYTWDDLRGYIRFEDPACGWWGCQSLIKDSAVYDNDLNRFIVNEVISVDPATGKQFVSIRNQGYLLKDNKSTNISFDPFSSRVLWPNGVPDSSYYSDMEDKIFWLGTQPDLPNFFLSRYPSPWGERESLIYKGSRASRVSHLLTEGTYNDTAAWFNPKLRTGTAIGTDLPVLMKSEIALFDKCYGSGGFSEPARYWIFHEAKKDFNDILSPTVDQVHSVMAAPGLRARLHSEPNMQGDMQWVSPPTDKAMILTCTDSDLLKSGDVESIYFDADHPDNIIADEYEHHVIVSASTCVGCDLRGFTFKEGLSLADVNFMFSDLTNANFNGLTIKGKGNFSNARLNGADLSSVTCSGGCVFESARMENTNLTDARLAWAEFHDTRLQNADFTGADLTGAVFVQPALSGTKFNGADLTRAALLNVSTVDSSTLKFDWKTRLSQVNFGGSNLNSINLGGFDLSGSKWKAGSYTTKGGVEIHYNPATLKGAYLFNTQLNGADLSGADLSYASWFGDQATGENAVCEGTLFEFADMPGIKLTNASLKNANFTDAALVGADLSNVTSLDGATFLYANLKGANLTGASLYYASLAGATVSGLSDEDTVQVLIDPDVEANAYSFYHQKYGPTSIANTDGVMDCPNGSRTSKPDCGPITVDTDGNLTGYWLPADSPSEPYCTTDAGGEVNCTKRGRQ